MPRVKNRSWSPRILAVGDRRIAMPARGTAEISNEDAESPEIQRQIADGSLIVLPEIPAAPSSESSSRKAGRAGGGATVEAGGGQG